MKRTVPLLITAAGGFVLIVAFFIPATEGWGEVAAMWFDILAAIAFILGGGNLLKTHLKKISDRAAGWGYSAVALVAFLATLIAGLGKVGTPPSSDQEFYGESFAELPLAAFPESQVTTVAGEIPQKAGGQKLPPSVRRQLSERDGSLVFRGWMLPDQRQDLLEYEDELQWKSTVESLFDAAQPPEELAGKVDYYPNHSSLGYRGFMTEEDETALSAMSDAPAWRSAVESLAARSREETRIQVEEFPEEVRIPQELQDVVFYDQAVGELGIRGPMSAAQRETLIDGFPIVRPLDGGARVEFRQAIEQHGAPLSEKQLEAFHKVLDGMWTVAQLKNVLNTAGEPRQVAKSASEMLEEKQAGVEVIEPEKTVGEKVTLNEAQFDALEAFADDREMSVDQLVSNLREAGSFPDRQESALRDFFGRAQTVGDRNRLLYFALLRAGSLTAGQRDFLLAPYRREVAWRQTVWSLFQQAHTVKYPWSGEYQSQGTPFWWVYEYVFKPLTATMFAMLAFYVASAAFRAFRAKNLEAILLLGTAFIILLGRTYAGVLLTAWLPESVAGLRLENLTVYIMNVFNTAGNRAIMIGIALGIASTSLKVLLGIDRSYLGSREE